MRISVNNTRMTVPVMRATDPEAAITALSHSERLGLVRFLDDTLRRIDDGVPANQLTALESQVGSFLTRLQNMTPTWP